MAIAEASFPGQIAGATAGALLFFIINLLVTVPFVRRLDGRAGCEESQSPVPSPPSAE
jgi:hypothetical protein